MYSLKKYNPDATIIILSDNATVDYIIKSKNQLINYVDEFRRLSLSYNLTAVQKSRYIKTSMRRYLDGNFFYLDTDTIVCKKINDNIKVNHIGAVKEWHQNNIISSQLKNYLKITKRNLWNNRYFNSGLLYVKDTEQCRNFFELWHKQWYEDLLKYQIHKDQPTLSLSNTLMENVIEDLDDTFNVQLWSPESIRFIFSAYVLHYQVDLVNKMGINFPFQDIKFLKQVREYGITTEINKIIEFPHEEYLKNIKILEGNEYKIYFSPVVTLAKKLSRDARWINNFVKFIYSIFGYRI